MNLAVVTALVFGAALAYANGSNDVSKGIATLVGSGVTDLRRAILWGVFWTGVGAFSGSILAAAMIQTFGKGLLGAGITPTFSAAIASICGAAVWVAFSTRFGLPVSTTHAIVGSLSGVAVVAYGIAGINWLALNSKILLPLLVSPILAMALTWALTRFAGSSAGAQAQDCACVAVSSCPALVTAEDDGAAAFLVGVPQLHLKVANSEECERESGWAAKLKLDHLHWLSSGAVSFARGLNDAPKLAALVLAVAALSHLSARLNGATFLLIAIGMMAGSWIAGLRVTRVLAENVSPMNHREGLLANVVTALLVGPGAAMGLPMSTTHVSSGAIIGIGTQNGGADWGTVKSMLWAWVLTLPGAAAIGIGCYYLISSLLAIR